MRTRILTFVAFVIALWWVEASGQTAQVPPTDSTLGKHPNAVSVPFYVNDAHGVPVTGITQADLLILDDKRPPQSVVGLRKGNELPLRLGVLIDKSHSQRLSKLYRPGLEAASTFLNHALTGADDKAFVVTFDTVPRATGFMDRNQLAALGIDSTPSGGTTLFDAVQLASDELIKADQALPARRVLVILSDGDDNQSHISLNTAIASAQRAMAVIFAVGTGEIESPTGIGVPGDIKLKRLAEQTGGAAFLHHKANDMSKVFAEIQGQIDGMYAVTYIPAQSGQAGRHHEIEVKAISNKHLRVRAPKGYYTAGQ